MELELVGDAAEQGSYMLKKNGTIENQRLTVPLPPLLVRRLAEAPPLALLATPTL